MALGMHVASLQDIACTLSWYHSFARFMLPMYIINHAVTQCRSLPQSFVSALGRPWKGCTRGQGGTGTTYVRPWHKWSAAAQTGAAKPERSCTQLGSWRQRCWPWLPAWHEPGPRIKQLQSSIPLNIALHVKWHRHQECPRQWGAPGQTAEDHRI